MAGMRSWSFRRILVFWWILFLVIQQAERLFLLPDAVAVERPAIGIVLKTLMTGFRADLIISTIAIICATAMAGIVGLILTRLRGMSRSRRPYPVLLTISSAVVSLPILIGLTADMGYYHHNHQHLDFVFFEYLDDLFGLHSEPGKGGVQAGQQTAA